MKEKIKPVLLLFAVFYILFYTGSALGGIPGTVLYYSAFLVPCALSVPIQKRERYEREELSGLYESTYGIFKLSAEDIKLLLPTLIPSVVFIYAAAVTSSLILSALGLYNEPIEISSLPLMLLEHAVRPAILEEAVFRYIPLVLLAHYSKKYAVIISSVFFALAHGNIFQIPYALIAGVIFIFLDIMFDSIIPSVAVHLVNNALSVILIKYADVHAASMAVRISMLVLAAISVVIILKRTDKYRERYKNGRAST